jgi:hypothetical protein
VICIAFDSVWVFHVTVIRNMNQALQIVFLLLYKLISEPGNSVSIVSGYGLDDQAIVI